MAGRTLADNRSVHVFFLHSPVWQSTVDGPLTLQCHKIAQPREKCWKSSISSAECNLKTCYLHVCYIIDKFLLRAVVGHREPD